MKITALIAEDEPLLAQNLLQNLCELWPELEVVSIVVDGDSALKQALLLLPKILFLDIRMPGLSGLDVATALAEDWPETHALPRIVFVTAFDQYAIQAFDAQAFDYLLKPLQSQRLARTIARLKVPQNLNAHALHQSLQHIEKAIEIPKRTERLQIITAKIGTVLYRIPIDEVLFFTAADKYVRVVTIEREYLIRTPIKILLTQLDPQIFWQIHRSTLVRAQAISNVRRNADGKISLNLNDHSESLIVSRLHADLFKAM